MSISSEQIHETVENQRRARNRAAIHRVAAESSGMGRCSKCHTELTSEERLLHAIFGTCPPPKPPTGI